MSHHTQGQCIYCSVGSCEYNERQNMCSLKDIHVSPKPGCGSGHPEESMCSSYRSRGK